MKLLRLFSMIILCSGTAMAGQLSNIKWIYETYEEKETILECKNRKSTGTLSDGSGPGNEMILPGLVDVECFMSPARLNEKSQAVSRLMRCHAKGAPKKVQLSVALECNPIKGHGHTISKLRGKVCEGPKKKCMTKTIQIKLICNF